MRVHLSIPVLVAFVLVGLSVPAEGGVREVNCNEGDSLQKAIERGGGSALPIEIHVSGECVETIAVRRSNVAIVGDEGTTIVGHFRVFGSDNVRIQNLTVTGSGNGITTVHSRVRIFDVHLIGNDGYGLAVRGGSSLTMRNGSISGNHGGSGLLLETSSANLSNVDVSWNASDGIVVNINSTLTMVGGGVNNHWNGAGIRAYLSSAVELVGLTVELNSLGGLLMTNASGGVANNSHFNENGSFGVLLSENSMLEMAGGSLCCNHLYGALVSRHGFLTLETVEVFDNHAHGLVVETDGGLIVGGNSVIDGNWAFDQIECRGKEASIEIEPGVVVGPVACIDPDF